MGITPLEKFREYLEARGKRLTPERATLLSEVFSSFEEFDTDQMVSRLANRADGKSVSRSTVHRRLHEMVEAGLIRRLVSDNGREVYAHD